MCAQMETEMPHTHRSYHPQGIADTLWKRARWARQARAEKKFLETIPKAEPKELLRAIAAYVTDALKTFFDKRDNEDAKRQGRSKRDKHNPQRRFNRQR